MQESDWQVFVQDEATFGRMGFRVVVLRYITDEKVEVLRSDGTRIVVDYPLSMEEVSIPPLFVLREFALRTSILQKLLQALMKLDLPQSKEEYVKGELVATKKHLDDAIKLRDDLMLFLKTPITVVR
jgi:hypothetical protein